MNQQIEETAQQQSRKLQERLDEQFEIRDRALRQEFGRVHKRIDDLIKDNEARDKGIKREFRNVYEKLEQHDGRFERLELKVDKISQKVDKIDTFEASFATFEASFATFEATFANFKVAHLNQRIQAIPVYDALHQPVPVPKCFPKTALRLYRLQDRKNCTSLSHYCQVLILLT
jgi:predicted  nucleic acid-binding Zn-ribbon protein